MQHVAENLMTALTVDFLLTINVGNPVAGMLHQVILKDGNPVCFLLELWLGALCNYLYNNCTLPGNYKELGVSF